MFSRFINSYFSFIKYLLFSFTLISLPLLYLFYQSAPSPDGFVAFLYVLSIPVYYFFLLMLISAVFVPLTWIKYVRYIILLPKILFDVFLLADYFVFKIYRFHIDMMFVKMAISDFKGIGLSPMMSVVSILAVLLIVFLNWRMYKWVSKKHFRHQKKFILLLFLLLAFGQAVHIWASEYKQHFIQQYTPYFPYYFPTTSHSLMKKIEKKHPGWIPKPVEKAHQGFSLDDGKSNNSLLNYPLQKLQFNDSIAKPNILMIVLESWRTDLLSPEATPMLDSLSRHSLRFNNHYSGGNVTVSGIFSLMYGLHPTYLPYVQADAYRYQTSLTKSLAQLNYDIKSYTSSNFDRFSLKAMLFGHIKNDHYINVLTGRADKADRKVVDQLIADIQNEKIHHWYKFVFLTSSHHHYNYPDQYKIFTPVPTNSEGFIFDKNIDAQAFINDYKNALRYEDALLSEVISALKKSGKYDNTIIIVTGDHAEEFNDNKQAYWGHGSNFTKYQTSVPLIVHLPQQENGKTLTHVTSHIDIVPTIFNDYLSCNNPINTYSSGKSLLDTIASHGLIMTSYKDKGYLINRKIYSTGLFVKSYSVDDINQVNKQYDYKALNELRREENHFLQK